MSDTLERLAGLSPERRKLLELRLKNAKAASASAEAPAASRREGGTFPLSFAQQRLWLVDRLQPGGSAYNMGVSLRLSGPLDVPALERALDEIVRRHETLRTTFADADGSPVQVIAPHAPRGLPVVDLSASPEAESEVRRLSAEEARAPFDLNAGPLFRTLLLRSSSTEHVLVLTMHHVVSDGWSMGVLLGELSALYPAFEAGQPSPLPELPLQYADHAVRQREQLAGAALERQAAYWKEALSGAPAMLELPADRPRPPVQSMRGAAYAFPLPAAAGARLAALAREEEATPFMALLAAWQLLLSMESGQDDVVVGTPIASRTRPELEGMIGFFANTLALRARIDARESFRALLLRVREATLGAYDHQDLPFEKLVEELQPERSLGHSPVFQAVFSLQGATPQAAQPMGGVEMRIERAEPQPKFDLSLTLFEAPGSLTGSLEYASDLFDRATVERIARHLSHLLEQAAAHADAPLAHLGLVPGDERALLLGGWNGTVSGDADPRPVHLVIAEQAARTPDGVALAFGDEETTYAEMDAQANRLANHLRRMGVGADVPVAISLERSAERIVAMLAVLKAGGAFLPVDPAYPAERRAYMLADSGAPVLLTHSALAADLPDHAARVVLIDAAAGEIAAESGQAPSVDAHPESLAYVIYTSGSTGRPKGVMVPHGGAANMARALADGFRVTADSRVLQFASFSFDAAVEEVLTALVTGATLVLAPQDEMMPGAPLAKLLRDRRVTNATLPPSALAAMEETDCPHLRSLTSAGEALTAEQAGRWFAGRHFVNAYGPTEATVCATMSDDEDGSRKPTIGRPVPNARVYVLGGGTTLRPIGVPGEICVGGVGVARGYLRRPGLTAEKFVPDPFAADGTRLYRTGDRGRWLADGRLEYLGRMDEQVKVRGFRIEPGEIEDALLRLPGVASAAVVAREDVPGDVRLVAYVVHRAGAELPSAGEMRDALRREMPEHMVPALYVTVDSIPLTPNGKVDRRALPAPERPADTYVAPSTPTEEALASLWAELLRAERVGSGDNFFDLGGHSLTATQMISRLRGPFGVELPLRALFEAPTLAGLAARIDAAKAGGERALPKITAISRASRRG
ncbi:MAG TPA: amino acid adenylation domain-containing protein [Longimicrobiaceae bacterium]|jgi:amino acid adenylation domain-containing protein|nr:amino acid adenylation domain-containing protein [Longimicrobiaceae bacterium]